MDLTAILSQSPPSNCFREPGPPKMEATVSPLALKGDSRGLFRHHPNIPRRWESDSCLAQGTV